MKTLSCLARFRDLTARADTSLPWTHLVPRGEFPGTIEIPAGYDVPGFGPVEEAMEVEGRTVIGDAQLESIVQRFRGEMLIDPDHLSHDMAHNTEAMGWGQQIRYMANRADGLEVETEWTDLGKDKILKKIYRFISPEFDGTVRFEDGVFKFYPSALTGAGLTNRPKLKALRPVSANRESNPNENMKSVSPHVLLCGLLGVPETTPEAELESKVTAFSAEVATSKNRAKQADDLEAENQRLNNEAIDHDLEIFADVIEDRDAARELLQVNRASTVKFFRAAQAKKGTTSPPEPLHQRNRATPPKGEKFSEADEEKVSAKYRQISGRATQLANDAKASGKSRDWNSCWAQAEAEAGA